MGRPTRCHPFLIRMNKLTSIFIIAFLIEATLLSGPLYAKDDKKAQSPNKRALKAADIYNIKDILDPQISPDGKLILFTLCTIDKDKNSYQKDVWSIAIGSNTPANLTNGGGNNFYARWSSDCQKIAFISDRTNLPQIWIMEASGANPTQLTNLEEVFLGPPIWSGDSKRIAFLGTHKNVAPDPITLSALEYNKDVSRIFIVDVDTKEVKTIVDSAQGNPSWSCDGKTLALALDKEGKGITDIWIVDSDTLNLKRLTNSTGTSFSPTWSADGKFIAYLNWTPDVLPWLSIYIVSLDAQQQICLTETVKTNISLSSLPGVVWSFDNKKIYFVTDDKGDSNVNCISIDDSKPIALTTGQQRVSSITKSSDDKTFSMLITDPTHLNEIWSLDADNKKMTQITNLNQEWLSQVLLAGPEEVSYQTFDGLLIEGWVTKPVSFDMMKEYPLLVYLYDGPQSRAGNFFWFDCQLLASNGYAVFCLNPRGSWGYGKNFLIKDFGDGDYQDILMGVNAVGNMGFVDKERLGILGAGFGAFMTNWIIGHTTIFKTALSLAGIWDNFSLYSFKDRHQYLEEYLQGYPWQVPDLYLKNSPISYAANIKTPTLIMHGEEDDVVPILQSEEFFVSLQRLKVESQFIRYPKEGHDFICGYNSGQPVHRVDRLNRILEWLDKSLKAK